MKKAMELETDLDGLRATVWRKRPRPMAWITDLLPTAEGVFDVLGRLLAIAIDVATVAKEGTYREPVSREEAHAWFLLLAVGLLAAIGFIGAQIFEADGLTTLFAVLASVSVPVVAVLFGTVADEVAKIRPPVAVRVQVDARRVTVDGRAVPLHEVASVLDGKADLTLVGDFGLVEIPTTATRPEDQARLARAIIERAEAARALQDGEVPEELHRLRRKPGRTTEGPPG